MKKFIVPVLAFVMAISFSGCGSNHTPDNVVINANSDLSKGLDLVALGELLKKSKDAKTLEEELNKSGSINNVDLDGDGKVDYLKVTEYGKDNEHGLSITDDVKQGETQEIATVQISKVNEQQADVNVQGNQDIYGPSANYHSSFNVGEFLLFSYLFMPHPFYMSPWGFGYYPPYYMRPMVMPYGAYHSRMQTMTTTSTMTRSSAPSTHITSPNAGKSSPTAVNRSIKSPTNSQKGFSARDGNKSVGKGGFGKGSNTPHTSPGSSSRRSFGGSSRGFGGGGHSFGGRRR